MEDYKGKYEHLLKFINDLYPHMSDYCKEKVDGYFPELKESEDEKIRKEIIQFLQLPHPQFVGKRNYEKWIIWLEKQCEQKFSWSEEDENEYNHILKILNSVAEEQETKSYNNLIGSIKWLKSLKERNTWKPSDRQMKQLGWVAEQNKDNALGKELMTLYQDLKKLREE